MSKVEKPTEIYLYGDIGDSFWGEGITENDVLKDLKELDPKAKVHSARVNSPGGRVDVGLTIMNLLRNHKQRMKAINPDFELHLINDGYAYSSASVIMMAGDRRIMSLGSMMMIHKAWTFAMGDDVALHEEAVRIGAVSDNAAEVYASITGRPADEMMALMQAETYFNADKAIEAGLATHKDSDTHAVAIAALAPETLQKNGYFKTMKARIPLQTFARPIHSTTRRDQALATIKLLELELADVK